MSEQTFDRNPNTRQCPYCRQWIALPVRRPMRAFGVHKAVCQGRLAAERQEAAK